MIHKILATGALLASALFGVTLLSGVPASAATAPLVEVVTPVHNGLALNVWGGNAYVDAPIRLYRSGANYKAEQFLEVPLGFTGAPVGAFQLEYAPGGVPSGLCVSTVTDIKGSYARLRLCAGYNTVLGVGSVANAWQDFVTVPEGDGLNQIEAVTETTPYFLNDKGNAANGGYVISWPSNGGAENQLWDVNVIS